MALAIRADFPLGIYQGHRENQNIPEKYPDPVRLFDALLSAAHGLAAFYGDDGKDDKTGLPPDLRKVIVWLENNSPDAVSLPEVYSVYDETGTTRAPSVFRKTGATDEGCYKIKEVAAVSRVGIGGPITWFWSETPEAAAVDVLRKIAHEVPYLGESSSLVLLNVDDSLSDIPESALFRRGEDFNDLGRPENKLMYVAESGRAEALQKYYEELHPRKPKMSETKTEHPKPYYKLCRERVLYGKKSDKRLPAREAPWARGLLLTVKAPEGVEWPPKDKDRVAWCQALHRTLVKKCGTNPPEALTGRYTSGKHPANNIAIQIIDDSLPVKQENEFDGTSFLLMLPNTMSEEDVKSLRWVVKKVCTLGIQGSKPLTLQYAREIDLCDFWAPPAENHRRYFEVQPLFILESRGPESQKKQGYGIARAAEIALGYVYRDFLSLGETRGDKRLEEMLDKVSAENVDVRGVHQVNSLDLNFYIHRKKRETSLWAGTALINLGNLDESACSLIAIGQSRHYGTGLLVPIDIPFDNGAGHDNDGCAARHG